MRATYLVWILIVSLLPACTLLGSGEPALGTATTAASPSSPPSPVATLPSPSPEPAGTDQPSQDCPTPSLREEIADFIAPAVGGSPVWAVMATSLSFAEVQQAPLSSYGYPYKVLWVVEKDYPGEVSLRGGSLDGTPLWFEIDQDEPTGSPILDPSLPGIPAQHPGFAEFPSYLYIPTPGCYFLEAHWDGGNWRVDFTVLD